MHALVLFPHQLFSDAPALCSGMPIYLAEDPLFFADTRYPVRFHRQRLMLHRASMRAFASMLHGQGHQVHYLEAPSHTTMAYLIEPLQAAGVTTLHSFDPADFILEKRLRAATAQAGMTWQMHPSPGFLCQRDDIEAFFADKKTYSQTSFYIAQRKLRGILLDSQGKPVGGKWSFDPDNRKKLPKGHIVPPLPQAVQPPEVAEARAYVRTRFPQALGEDELFIYPVTHTAAAEWLSAFLEWRLAEFGDYEDALSVREDFVFHSLLSPLINTGLLTPQQVLDATLAYAESHPVPLNALEGCVRQILGWREYMRALYVREGVRERTSNYWGHTRSMPTALYQGTTGIYPVDHVIAKLQRCAYAHHIERLMVLGNFMCLCEIAPDAIYQWFMEFFIDAYDWVMVPNVYGMSQYADGGLMTTKPYISGSNYLRKMSDYPPGPWTEVWDGLYWRFIAKHHDFFSRNPRLSVMTRQLDKMGTAKLQAHIAQAEQFLAQLA
jgi:deoxyribodipyrimidine photolyase-related protein